MVAEVPNLSIKGPYLDVREFYKTLKALFTPSMWEEAFGRVVVEAGLSGIPVLASNRGGLPEALNGGGLILPQPFIDGTGTLPVQEVVLKNKDWFLAFEQLKDETFYKELCIRTQQSSFNMVEKIKQSYQDFLQFIETL